jgi:hypothetical protein
LLLPPTSAHACVCDMRTPRARAHRRSTADMIAPSQDGRLAQRP